MPYTATKTYGHERGLSCCFRQWRATHSHCRLLHGYALSFKITFGCLELDEHGWVIDFGAMDEVKYFLESTFDHKLVAAHDDLEILNKADHLDEAGIADIVFMEAVGCEAFAKHVHEWISRWLHETQPRVFCSNVTVSEHGSNSATYWKAYDEP